MPIADDRVHVMHNPAKVKPHKSSIRWKDDLEMQLQPLEMQLASSRNSRRRTRTETVQLAQEQVSRSTVQALQNRSFHLPTNATWCEDWRQYLANNHPLWSLCCADKLHPIGWGHRLIALVISVLVGLTATNAALWWSHQGTTWEDEVVSITFSTNITRVKEGESLGLTVSMVFLWSWISCAHSIHDCVVWYFCCSTSGANVLWLLVWVGAAAAFTGLLVSVGSYSDYNLIQVLLYTVVEVLISWFFWFPFVATILFSGILGCFRLPILGGRPRDLYIEALELHGMEKRPVNTMDSLQEYDT